jgi:hypothetical protein
MCMEHWWNDSDRGNGKYLEKPLSKANFFTTNHTRTAQVSDPGFCDETTMTNHLRIALSGYIL